jgi:drug/metabolite transporter (DMT)-like permease
MDDGRHAGGSGLTWAAFAGCSLIWGSTFLVISIGNDALPPLWALTLRLAVAATLLLAITAISGQRLPRGAALRAAAIYGALNMGLSMSLLYHAETSVPSGLVAVLYATIPLSTALFARIAGLERLRPLKVAGALVAIGGVVAIVAGHSTGTLRMWPVAEAVLAAACAAASGVALKRGPRQPPLPANAIGSLTGLAVAIVAGLLTREAHPMPTGAAGWLPVLYLAVMGSIGAFGLYAWLVNHWPVTRIAFVSVVVPVVAVSLGAILRGERFGVAEVSGSALVLAGLALGILSDRRA